jgi:Protein of unknown function (DUF2934)
MNDKRIEILNVSSSVPKKKKTAEDNNEPPSATSAPIATKKTAAKRQAGSRVTTAKKPRKATATKHTTAGPTQISASPRTEPAEPFEPSEDTIRLRAYYISERRRRFALPGDAESDWLEAKRQLLAESRR